MSERTCTVLLLAGGDSAERAVSLESGAAVAEALAARGHAVASTGHCHPHVVRAVQIGQIHRPATVDDGLEPGLIRARLTRMLGQALDRGRRAEQGDAAMHPAQLEDLGRIEPAARRDHLTRGLGRVRQDIAARAVRHRRGVHDRVARLDAVDVGEIAERHRQEVAVGQHRPLGPPGGAAGVEQPGDVVGGGVGRGHRRSLAQLAEFGASDGHATGHRGLEIGRHEAEFRARILKDVAELARVHLAVGQRPPHELGHDPALNRVALGTQFVDVWKDARELGKAAGESAIALCADLRYAADDAAWRDVPPATEFLQRDPDEGKPATERTELRIVYDAANIFVGVRLYDREPARIVRRLTRRDDFPDSDRFTIYFDPHHDHLTGAMFTVSAAGPIHWKLIGSSPVPGCAPKIGPENAISTAVVTPHAAFLALDFAPEETIANLQALAADFPGLYGRGGFKDSLNVATGQVADRYLALDQGMVLAALANALTGDRLQGYLAVTLGPHLAPLMAIEEFGAGRTAP